MVMLKLLLKLSYLIHLLLTSSSIFAKSPLTKSTNPILSIPNTSLEGPLAYKVY
jgi:hypothetical protein